MQIEGSNDVSSTPTPAAEGGSDRASLLAGLESIPDTTVAPVGPVSTEAAEPVDTKPAEIPAADPADTDDVEPAEVASKPVTDPELAKRLDTIQKQERRAKESLAKERAELEAKFKPEDLAELAELRELRRRAKLGDPHAILKLTESTEDDAEAIARNVYKLSKKAAENPANREEVARTVRERELSARLEATEQRFAALEKQLADRDAAVVREQENSTYLEAAAKNIDDSTPIVRAMFSKNPQLARQRVAFARDYLAQQTGEIPDAADVLKALEAVERDELTARGIDPDLVRAKPSTPVAAGEKRTAKTLNSDLSSPTTPRTAPASPKEEREHLLKALESGRLD